MLEFEGEDGPRGTFVAALTWSRDGSARAGIEADRLLDGDPHRGVRGPLAHLESGASTHELPHGPVPVTALVAELLARALRAATRELGVPPDHAVLAIPSGWPPDGRRARAMRAAAAIAGLPDVTLIASAVAAAELVRDAEPVTALICDVGGRSCQLSLVEIADGPARLLATTELVVGADLFDELLYLDVLRELGEHDGDAAARLEDVHLQSGAGEPDGELWAACQAGLARAVRHAREALTSEASHRLEIGAPVGHAVELDQQRVRDLLLTEMLVLAGAAREQIAQARLSGALPSGRAGHPRVLLVGGGALTPGLRDTLEAELDLAVIADEEPATAVARGALPAGGRAVSRVPERAVQPASRRGAVQRSQTQRSILEDVVVATMSGDDVLAVVRHDAHHRVVRVDVAGRVRAASGVAGRPVTGLAAALGSVVVSSAAEAAVFNADLRLITTIERPLLAAAGGDSVWIVSAGDEPNAVLDLTTLRIAGRDAPVHEVQRLGLATSPQTARLPRRGVRTAPPPAHGVVTGDRLRFAAPARGRSGNPTQRVGCAGPAGLLDVETRLGPDWVIGQAAADAGSVVTLAGAGGPVTLFAAEQRLAGWPEGVRVWLAAHEPLAPWIVAARQSRWEALRLDGTEVVSVRAGDGTVESAGADEDGLRLVCESGGERRLVRVTASGELHRLAALGAPLEPLGCSGAEILALAGPPGVARTLLSITPG